MLGWRLVILDGSVPVTLCQKVQNLLIQLMLEQSLYLAPAERLGKGSKVVLEGIDALGKVCLCTERSFVVLDLELVGRFIKLLQDFKAESQFVVITHNPRTIEAADWIYGVTMEEAGISTIVGVKLEEALEAAGAA